MEEKLKEFKSRRRREMLWNKPKNFFKRIIENISINRNLSEENTGIIQPLVQEQNTPKNSCERINEDQENSILSEHSDNSILLSSESWLSIVTYALYFLLWLIIYLIAIQLEFGYVYLVSSGLIFIYFNTRTEPKKEGEISAYSVFNPGCEAIEGTLKAEQLEREFNLIHHT